MTSLEKAMEDLALAMSDLARRDAASTEEMKRSIAESRRDYEAKIAASDAKIAESRRETDAKIAASDARIAAATEKLKDLGGEFRNRIGDITEMILVPGLRLVMEAHGHDFTRVCPNEKFYVHGRRKKRDYAEVDLFLENPTEAMAVEVKTHMRDGDVTMHLAQLETLRKHEDVTGLKGKALYGAMAGLQIDKTARKLALENGLYLIEMVEDTKYVNVVEPPSGVRGW